jgi:hypothetical protein
MPALSSGGGEPIPAWGAPGCPSEKQGPAAGRWGAGLTPAKMAECRWIKPVLVGQFEFVEWAAENHLRHVRFVGMREDKNSKQVLRKLQGG